MTAAGQNLTKEVGETKTLISRLVAVITAFMAAGDAVKQENVALKADVARLTAENAELKGEVASNAEDVTAVSQAAADLDQAQTEAQAVLDSLPAGSGGGDTGGGSMTPIEASYADRASFDAAVGGYTGAEGVSIDGETVREGEPMLEFFTHSADGHIDTTGPTD